MTTYKSTRGAVTGASFEEVVLGGLAPDRGLYVPDSVPKFTAAEIEGLRDKSFADIAFAIQSKFIPESEIPAADLKDIIQRSTAAFRDGAVTPCVKTGNFWTLELFHGPTFAFKDVALQELGNLFEYFIARKTKPEDQRLTIMGATSGDTGSAAIYGLRGKKGVNCFILYPKGRVSLIQEQQMTTVPDENIHCLRVEGTFDDAQDIVKSAFMDVEFRNRVKLGAVNSINWARVLAQITYYFSAYYQVTPTGSTEPISFSVPTGNFGDILAGYYAKLMGLPVGKLVVGTNENDILDRFFKTGEYVKEGVQATISPSMDICVSSNFERYLFHVFGEDPEVLRSLMEGFEGRGQPVTTIVGSSEKNKLAVTSKTLEKARADFASERAPTKDTLDVIRQYNDKHQYLFCPHSAVGVVAAIKLGMADESMVCLATAHAGKFYDAVSKAIKELPPLPPALAAVQTLPMRHTDVPNDLKECERIVMQRSGLLENDGKHLPLGLVLALPAIILMLIFGKLYEYF